MDYLRDLITGFKLPLTLCLLGIVLLLGGFYLSSAPKTKIIPSESIVSAQTNLKVDISGAILNPGVYEMNSEERIEDLIEKAGGFLENANLGYISKSLNLAQKVVDGSKIYIPFQNEDYLVEEQTNSKVNINTASSEKLESLSGIGEVTAGKIIAGRPYSSIQELVSKKIISKSVFEKVKDQLTLY